MTYHGAVTDPQYGSADAEIELEHGDGTSSCIRYRMPAGVPVPLEVGMAYFVTYRVSAAVGSYKQAVVVSQLTRGLSPLVFVAEVGIGPALVYPEDPLMMPVSVTVVAEPDCPSEPSIVPNCLSPIYRDSLLFDSSTGGMCPSQNS